MPPLEVMLGQQIWQVASMLNKSTSGGTHGLVEKPPAGSTRKLAVEMSDGMKEWGGTRPEAEWAREG